MGLRDDVVPVLQNSELFAGYSRGELEALAPQFDEQTFLADHRIVTEGRAGMDFFIILEGEAEVGIDGRAVARLHPGDFFGEVAVLDEGPRTATVRAVTQLRALGLPNKEFKPFLLENPRFAVNVLQAVARRFRGVVTAANQQPV